MRKQYQKITTWQDLRQKNGLSSSTAALISNTNITFSTVLKKVANSKNKKILRCYSQLNSIALDTNPNAREYMQFFTSHLMKIPYMKNRARCKF